MESGRDQSWAAERSQSGLPFAVLVTGAGVMTVGAVAILGHLLTLLGRATLGVSARETGEFVLNLVLYVALGPVGIALAVGAAIVGVRAWRHAALTEGGRN